MKRSEDNPPVVTGSFLLPWGDLGIEQPSVLLNQLAGPEAASFFRAETRSLFLHHFCINGQPVACPFHCSLLSCRFLQGDN